MCVVLGRRGLVAWRSVAADRRLSSPRLSRVWLPTNIGDASQGRAEKANGRPRVFNSGWDRTTCVDCRALFAYDRLAFGEDVPYMTRQGTRDERHERESQSATKNQTIYDIMCSKAESRAQDKFDRHVELPATHMDTVCPGRVEAALRHRGYFRRGRFPFRAE